MTKLKENRAICPKTFYSAFLKVQYWKPCIGCSYAGARRKMERIVRLPSLGMIFEIHPPLVDS